MNIAAPAPFDLNSGERLLWSGAPRSGIVFRRSDLTLVPFSILWLAVFTRVYRQAARSGPFDGALWSILFAAGLYLLIGRFLFDALRRHRTVYAVTSDRVLMINTILSRYVKSFTLDSITDIALDERANGIGDIWLGRRFLPTGWQDPGTLPSRTQRNGIEMIPGAKLVYDIILAAQQAKLVSTI